MLMLDAANPRPENNHLGLKGVFIQQESYPLQRALVLMPACWHECALESKTIESFYFIAGRMVTDFVY